jgi:pilus assembly protein TadC
MPGICKRSNEDLRRSVVTGDGKEGAMKLSENLDKISLVLGILGIAAIILPAAFGSLVTSIIILTAFVILWLSLLTYRIICLERQAVLGSGQIPVISDMGLLKNAD